MAMKAGPARDWRRALVEAYAVNEQMNQMLLAGLDERAWRADPPGGKGRPIAAIFAHIHNVRHMWLVVSAKDLKIQVPPKLDRDKCTRKQATAALSKSAAAITKLLEAGLAREDLRVKDFRPDAAGAFGYMIAHEAHHRGQICMLARQLGYKLDEKVHFGMWEWGKLWNSLGFETRG
jgi:uncharacterized damage-inducible protein DinB